MRQLTRRDGRDLGEIVRAVDLDLVETADCDIGKRAIGVVDDVDVIGDRSSVESLF